MAIIGCFAAYNEEEWIGYSLRNMYNVCDRIILVEGCIAGYDVNPHSTDRTMEIVKEVDKDNKIEIVQIEGFWKSLEEQKNVFTQRANIGDILVINDADEFYNPEEVLVMANRLQENPELPEITPLFIHFVRDFNHIARPIPNAMNITHQRIIKMGEGYHHSCHHPTACDKFHRDTFLDPYYEARREVAHEFYIYHFGYMRNFEKMMKKCTYYRKTFDRMTEEQARNAASYDAGEGLKAIGYLEFDGKLPSVLDNHPLRAVGNMNGLLFDTIEIPHWKSVMEYSTHNVGKTYNRMVL